MFVLIGYVNYPFPQDMNYPCGYTLVELARSAGISLSQNQVDKAVAQYYEMWKQKYLILDKIDSSGNPYYRILHYIEENDTVSEGQGYGMLIAVYMAGYDSKAREIFDGLYRYVLIHLDCHGLMDWKIIPADNFDSSNSYASWMHYDPTSGDYVDNSSATDGDLDIAMALLLADAQWGSGGNINYREEALKWLERIKRWDFDDASPQALYGAYETNDGTVRLGDWWVEADPGKLSANLTRTSDFMPAWFRIFYRVTGDEFWYNATEAVYKWVYLIQDNFSNSTGLLPDFIDIYRETPALPDSLESQHDGDYYYNSCRDPWRLSCDYLWFGEQRAYSAVKKMVEFIVSDAGGDATSVKDGYYLNGTAFGTTWGGTPALSFVVPFGVGGCVDLSFASWVVDVFDYAKGTSQSYYEDTLALLGMLLMSGNAWNMFMEPTWSVSADLRDGQTFVAYPSLLVHESGASKMHVLVASAYEIEKVCGFSPSVLRIIIYDSRGRRLASLDAKPGKLTTSLSVPLEKFYRGEGLYFFVIEARNSKRSCFLKGRGKVVIR